MENGVNTATSDTDDDRRGRPRTAVSVELKLLAPEHHLILLSRTVDLSTTGAFVRTSRALPIGAQVRVAFQRGKDRNPLTLDAEVVRVGTADGGRQAGIAVRFLDVTSLDEALLADIIGRAAV
jgi:hypothetical protein